MRCVKCNSEIETDAQFCPYCGKEVEQVKQCSKCGKTLDEDSDFCPYCGSKQCVATESNRAEEVMRSEENCTSQEDTIQHTSSNNRGGSKKLIWIACAILFLGVLYGGYILYGNNSSDMSRGLLGTEAVGDSEGDSDVLQSQINDIITEVLKMDDAKAVQAYFSVAFQKLYSDVDEVDKRMYELYRGDDYMGYWNGNLLDGAQEGTTGHKIIRINTLSERKLDAEVALLYDYGESKNETKCILQFINENGKWVIDDVDDNHKKSMADYIKSVKTLSVSVLLKLCQKNDRGLTNKMLAFYGYKTTDGVWKKDGVTISVSNNIINLEAVDSEGKGCAFPQNWFTEINDMGYDSEEENVGQLYITNYRHPNYPIISVGTFMDHWKICIGSIVSM